MSIKNTSLRYGSVMKLFHWLIFVLIAVMLLVGFTMGKIPSEDLKYQVYDIHKLIGMIVLSLGIFFLFWRISSIKPRFPDSMPAWERSAARIVHVLLYLLIIAMPISGWIMATASGYPPQVGNWEIPVWGITKNEALAKLFADVHYTLAWTLVCFVGIHTIAALKHHFWDKDDVLKRMFPGG